MNVDLLSRAQLFVMYVQVPILYMRDPFRNGRDYWFVAFNFSEANPANHMFVNELKEGKDITDMMMNANQYDQQLFKTQLDAIHKTSLVFPQAVDWIKIK